MPTYEEILATETNSGKPITQSLMERMRDNPRAVASGDPSVPNSEKINVPAALRTTEVDVSAVLSPDGAGGVRWSGGGFAGAGIDGVFTGPLVAGVYHCTSAALVGAQTPTGPVEIHCQTDFASALAITSSYPVVIKAGGNVTLPAITCRGLEVRCVGDLTRAGNIIANSGLTPTLAADDLDKIGVLRFYVGGDYTDGAYSTAADDILCFILGALTLAPTTSWLAQWAGSGAAQSTDVNGSSWRHDYGGSALNGGDSSNTTGQDAGGGGGGLGGGAGGDSDGHAQVGGAGDPYRTGNRLYAVRTDQMRRGGGGGSTNAAAGGNAGGRLSVYVGGNANFAAAAISAEGQDVASAGTSDPAGGGGGTLRVVCRGTLTDCVVSASGGDGGPSDGGGGGGGSATQAAGAYAGTCTVAAAGGVSGGGGYAGTGGTTAQDTLTTDQMDTLVALGVFNV